MKVSLRKTPSHLHLAYKYGEASNGLLGRNFTLDVDGHVLTVSIDLTPNFHTRNKGASAYLEAVNFSHNHHKLRYLQCSDNLVRARLIRAWEQIEQPQLRMCLELGQRGRYLYAVQPHSLFMGGIQFDVDQVLERRGQDTGTWTPNTRAPQHQESRMKSLLFAMARARRCLLLLVAACTLGFAAAGATASPSDLHTKYNELREELRHSNFHRPLHIDSAESGNAIRGDVYAVLDHPFTEVSAALKDPAGWCEILILPFNTKYCHPANANGQVRLQLRIGRKSDQPVQDAYRLDFTMQPVAAGPDYFETRLNAGSGPIGTRDYRIVVSAIPLDGGRSFMHLGYSYAYGFTGRLAMQAYLSTAGADKVGFTLAGRDANGQPVYIGGVRGAIERNVMRYYLAIDAHLSSLSAPPERQLEKRIEAWFDATERYPRQLHEMDRPAYIAMKRSESERQQAMIE
jgi:hypothetical protein